MVKIKDIAVVPEATKETRVWFSQSINPPALINMDTKQAGVAIKLHRELKGLSQTELSVKSGVSLRTVQRLEKGENIRIDLFFDLITALNLEIQIGNKIKG